MAELPTISGDSRLKWDIYLHPSMPQLMVKEQKVSGRRCDCLSCRGAASSCLLIRIEGLSCLLFQVLCGSALQREWSWWVSPPQWPWAFWPCCWSAKQRITHTACLPSTNSSDTGCNLNLPFLLFLCLVCCSQH